MGQGKEHGKHTVSWGSVGVEEGWKEGGGDQRGQEDMSCVMVRGVSERGINSGGRGNL
jgi:hypothetical protein